MLWNARGLMSKLVEFKLYLSHSSFTIVCVTETHLRAHHSPRFPGYIVYRQDRPDGYGGLLILVSQQVQQRSVTLTPYPQGLMEGLAVDSALCGRWSRTTLLYNPCQPISREELDHYLSRAGSHDIVCGDFNAHHPAWSVAGCRSNATGTALFDVLHASPLLLLNPVGVPTRIDPHSGAGSVLDLFFGAPHFHLYAVSLGLDLGSDHTPVLLSRGVQERPRLLFRPRWSLPRESTAPEWAQWRSSIAQQPLAQAPSLQVSYDTFCSTIIQCGKNYFPLRDSSRPRRPGCPGWTAACARAVHARRSARKTFSRHPTPANRASYNGATHAVRETVSEARRASWSAFVAQLSPQTSMSVVWKMFRAVTGRLPSLAIPLTADAAPLPTQLTAETLASHFASSFSHRHRVSPAQEAFTNTALTDDGDPALNSDFTAPEMVGAMGRLTTRTAPGLDLIHNAFLTSLPDCYRHFLRTLFNTSLQTAVLPAEWRSALIIPILKPGKDPCEAASYRPISLLSCVSKLMERLVCARLTWFLETHAALLPQQFGFRRRLSTVDALTSFEHDIQLALRTQQTLIVVYFDLSSAFDRASPPAILYKLARAGVRGRLLRWVRSFLADRSFRVAVEGCMSSTHLAATGVPQGSILSPLLFNVLLSDIPQVPGVVSAVYADDITMYAFADDVEIARGRLQGAVDGLVRWARSWGLVVNPSKSASQLFTRKHISQDAPLLTVEGSPLPLQRRHRLLGLIFDAPSLTWRAHIEDLRRRCHKRLNVLRSLSGSRCGGNRQVLLRFYQAYIRGCTDYGLPLYSSASPTLLASLDVVHSTAARLIVGAWKSAPLPALYCELGCLPPQFRRELLVVSFYIQLLHRPALHPVHSLYRRDRFLHIAPFRSPSFKLPLLSRALDLLSRWGIVLPPSSPSEFVTALPPWFPGSSCIHLSFPRPRGDMTGEVSSAFGELVATSYGQHLALYTDGSLSLGPPRRVGAALVVPSLSYVASWGLDGRHSILAAELFALLQAVTFIVRRGMFPAVVFTDSLSALHLLLQSFSSTYSHLVGSIHRLLAAVRPGSIRMQWIPSHAGIGGNERADAAAKAAATDQPLTELLFSSEELRAIVRRRAWESWQVQWTALCGRYALGAVKPSVHCWSHQKVQSRYFERLFATLRLGCAPLNLALHRIQRSPSPLCQTCNVAETSSHYLTYCTEYAVQRAVLRRSLSALGFRDVTLATCLGGDRTAHPHWSLVCAAVEAYIRATHRFDA